MSEETNIATLITTKPETEVAAELKARAEMAFIELTAVMDEALRAGLIIQWDAVGPMPPTCKNKVHGLRVVKHFT